MGKTVKSVGFEFFQTEGSIDTSRAILFVRIRYRDFECCMLIFSNTFHVFEMARADIFSYFEIKNKSVAMEKYDTGNCRCCINYLLTSI